MSELTKNQRNKVYKRALKVFMAAPDPLCCIIDVVDLGLFNLPEADDTSIEFVELATFKPENKSPHEAWWPLNDDQSRIDCLKKCIEMTEPKKKGVKQ